MSQTSKHDLESNGVPSGLWKSRTLIEKISLPANVILVILSITLLVVIMVTPSTASKNDPEVCSTPGCVQAANYFLNAINASVDPCTDFFEFSCGLWKEQNPIPQDQSSVTSMFLVDERISKQLDGILANKGGVNTGICTRNGSSRKIKHYHFLKMLLSKNVTSEAKSINMARILYQSCINTARIEELKSRPLVDAINALGKWPILEKNWDKNSFKLTDLLIMSFRDNNVIPFFIFLVSASEDMLYLSQEYTAHAAYLLDPAKYSKEMGIYRNCFRQLVQFVKADLNLSKSDDEINQDIDKVIAFETEIVKIQEVAEIGRDGRRKSKNFKRCKMQDLYELIPQIDWVDYFRRIAHSELNNMFSNETKITVTELDYMKKLSKLLESTDASVVANYVIYRVARSSAEYLDKRFADAEVVFSKVFDPKPYFPRNEFCSYLANMHLSDPTSVIYVEEHFRESHKQEAVDLVLHLKKSFLEMLQQNDWIDKETKSEAIKKLNSMRQLVGYKDEIKDFKKLDEKFELVEIKKGDSFLKIVKAFEVGATIRSLKKILVKKIYENQRDYPAATVGASYSEDKNRINFAAGMLQPPFFSGMFPKAVNYGAIGVTIGHEMTHGFDNLGSQYDKDGKMHNWWSNSSWAIFKTKTNCIVEQYNGYTVPGTTQKLNGEISQGENIGDIGGLKIAFRAYKKYLKEHGDEPRLPGLQHYTNEQIFFLSYGSANCEQYTVETSIMKAQRPHSPRMFRTNGPLSNMKEFADAYNCPRNSPINPDHKCVVW